MNCSASVLLLLLLVGSLSASHHHRRHHENRSDEDRSDEDRHDDHHNNKKQERKPSNGLLSSALGLAVGGAARLVNPVITGARVVQPAVSTVVEGAKEVAVITTDPRPIFPGTRWCGAGTRAKNESDIGLFEGVDSCCRVHDNCDNNIPAGESRHGLNNTGSYTLSHCDCDELFHSCLKEDGSIPAKKVGFTYFNVLRPQCFREERVIVRCAKTIGLGPTKRCQSYEFSSSEDRRYQWFDAQEF